MPTSGQGQRQGLGQIWNPDTLRFESNTSLPYDPEFNRAWKISEETWNTYTPEQQMAVLDNAKSHGYESPTQPGASEGLGGWFKDNKDMIGAGLGAAQL